MCPTIPGYDARQNIKAGPGAAFRQEAAASFEPLNNVLGAVTGEVQRWSEVHDAMQGNNAKYRWSEYLGGVKSRALMDPAVTKDKGGMPVYGANIEGYLDEIAKKKVEILDSIDNKMLASQLAPDFSLDESVAGIQIKDHFLKKYLQFAREDLDKEVTSLTGKMLDSSLSVSERNMARQRRDLLLTDNLERGVIDIKEKNAIEKAAVMTMLRYRIAEDSSITEEDSSLLRELKDNEHSYAKDLPADQRIKLIKELQYRISTNRTRNDAAVIQDRFRGRVDILKGIASGQVSLQDPAFVTQMTIKDPRFGQVLTELSRQDGMIFRGTGPERIVDADQFASMVQGIYNTASVEELDDFLMTAVKSLGTSQAGYVKLGILTEEAIAHAKTLQQNVGDGDAVDKSSKVKQAFQFVAKMLPGLYPFVNFNLLQKVHDKGLTGDAIKEEMQKTVVDVVNQAYPETVGLEGVPNKIISGDGSLIDAIYLGPNQLDGDEYGTDAAGDSEPAETIPDW